MRLPPRSGFLAVCSLAAGLVCALLVLGLSSDQGVAEAPRTDRRLLFSFEEPEDLNRLSRRLDQAELIVVQDNGVTEGKHCARLTIRKGAEYGGLELDARAMKGWAGFDYFAIDCFMEDATEYRVVVELWDGKTRNYATRCTWEDVTTHAGRQTLLYPIKRARRNGKEGRDWNELEPQDKIDLNGLTRVRIFVSAKSDQDAVFWLDHLRLLQEDAAKPKLALPVPAGAIAFNFGSAGSTAPGFQQVTYESKITESGTAGFLDSSKREDGGEGWPDLIAGTFVTASDGQELDFRAKISNGEYHYWLIAGPIYRIQPESFSFRLLLNGSALADVKPTPSEYYSERHLYRFLRSQYSQHPDGLWTNFVQRMYPVRTGTVRITDGTLRLQAVNHFISGLVLMPVASEPDFLRFTEATERLRREAFQKTLPAQTSTFVKSEGKKSCLIYFPDRARTIRPSTRPTSQELARTKLAVAGTPGERVIMRLAVLPGEDLGQCTVTLSDLKQQTGALKAGSRDIPAELARVYFQNYRYDGTRLDEMALIPQSTWKIEPHVTQCCWIWWQIPPKTARGIYRGQVKLQPQTGPAQSVPIEVEVYPFTLNPDLPVSYGLYFAPRTVSGLDSKQLREIRRQQLQFMREIGLTSVSVGGPSVQGLGGNSTVKLRFETELFDLAKEIGLARQPGQFLMATALGMGRGIGRRLPRSEGPLVDRNPGIELKQPEFPGYFLNGARQYHEFLKGQGLPVAVEIVDEPRETPNPWNRNLADTITYSKLLHQAGLTTFVTPMSDQNDGKDYTVLAEHADIISIHAWPASKGLIAKTRAKSKTLWLYNTGMDRFSWGFYPWSIEATGRWEWHFCWNEDRGQGGYPGRDGFNPFTGTHGFVPDGPIDQSPIFQSKLLDVADGITDLTYVHTLSQRMAELKASTKNHPGIVAGEKLLTRIRTAVPEFPEVKGLADASAGALVGEGVADHFQTQAENWRREIADILKQLDSQ